SFSLINLNALASPIPKDKLAAYQEAVNLAINQHPLKCVFYTDRPEWNPEVSSGLTQAISATTSGDLNSDGDQPVLTFSNQSDAQF
ncbi:hypothetical protein, partial [Pseudomonas sp. FW305-33]|uniref:hypothetical protein n=1 Tax=Pseudomonas sp. FW305-33 TaxID=2751337 RepID=UPI001304FBB1